MKAAYGLSCCESSRFGEGDIAGKNGEDDPNEFLHSVGHSNVIMLPLRPFTVDIGTERNRINVSHIGSAVERPALLPDKVDYLTKKPKNKLLRLIANAATMMPCSLAMPQPASTQASVKLPKGIS